MAEENPDPDSSFGNDMSGTKKARTINTPDDSEVAKNGNEKTVENEDRNDEVKESKSEKEETEEKMDCTEKAEIDKKGDPPKEVTDSVVNPVESSEKPKESDQTVLSPIENNSDNKNIPENFACLQNKNKESNDQSNKEEAKDSKENNPPATKYGNEESHSQCSMFEESTETKNCYCGQDRNLNVVELQCGGCNKWFHEHCLNISIGKCVPFMTYYSFHCKRCNPNGVESFSKKQPSFSQMCVTALANLMQQYSSDSNPRTMFSKDKEVIPYIVANWEYLTTMQRRIKQTWHNTVYKAMVKDSDVFVCEEKGYDSATDSLYPMFGLVNQDLMKIAPSYDNQGRVSQKLNIDSCSSQGGSLTGTKGRTSKRKYFDSQMSGAKRVKSVCGKGTFRDGKYFPSCPHLTTCTHVVDLVMPKLPPNGYPLEHPFNKDGYRYILAEPDPHAPFRQEFDESQDWAGKPIPGWLYRKLTPCNVLVALHDRAPQLKVSEDRLSVTGEKGYCMARATHGVNRGTWYFEITIEDMPDGAATRLGWSQPLGNLQGPLGYDKFSYSWRSRKGTKFHESRGYHYSDEGYGQGDVLGFLIHLPETSSTIPLPHIYKDKPLVKFKSYLYYEEKDEPQLELKNMKPLPGSKMVFYKNGKCMGAAFQDISAGTYYPAISLYKNVTVSLNFGPNLKYPPQEKFKPICELAHEATIEQAMTDLLFFTENKGKLRLDTI